MDSPLLQRHVMKHTRLVLYISLHFQELRRGDMLTLQTYFFPPRSFPFTRLGFHETALKTRNEANLSKNIKIWNATAMNKKFSSLAKREKKD